MNAREYLKVIRRKWPVIIACGIAAGLVMWLITPANPGQVTRIGNYDATATLLINTTGGEDGGMPGVSLDRVALFITTGEVPKRVAERVEYQYDPAILANQLSVTPNPSSMSMTLKMSGTNAEYVTNVTNTFAEEAVAFFAENPPGLGRVRLDVLQAATPIPVVASGGFTIPPSRALRTSLATLLGLLIGFGIALVLHQVDSRLRTRDEVYEALRMPVVAEIPKLGRSARENARILVADEPHGVYADGYRTARAAVMHTASLGFGRGGTEAHELARSTGARVVLVTSAQAGEGKTTSIANLAASFAETGQSILVLDADLRSPDLHLLFDVPQGAGISDFLYDPSSTQLAALARPTSVPGVKIITAGTQLAHPASLATRMGVLVDEARKVADIILIDTAPLLAASDVFDLLPIVDTVLFVVRNGRITEGAAQRVSELLGRFHVPVTGAILVGIQTGKGYGYGYGYGSASDDPAAQRRASRKKRRSKEREPRPPSLPPAVQPRPTSEPDNDFSADPVDDAGKVGVVGGAGSVEEFDPYAGYDLDRDGLASSTPSEPPIESRRHRRRSSG